jgi:hypothetical protein
LALVAFLDRLLGSIRHSAIRTPVVLAVHFVASDGTVAIAIVAIAKHRTTATVFTCISFMLVVIESGHNVKQIGATMKLKIGH